MSASQGWTVRTGIVWSASWASPRWLDGRLIRADFVCVVPAAISERHCSLVDRPDLKAAFDFVADRNDACLDDSEMLVAHARDAGEPDLRRRRSGLVRRR